MQGTQETAAHEADQRQPADQIAAAGIDQHARAAAHADLHGNAEDERCRHHRRADRRMRATDLIRKRGKQGKGDRRAERDCQQLGEQAATVPFDDQPSPGTHETETQPFQGQTETQTHKHQQGGARSGSGKAAGHECQCQQYQRQACHRHGGSPQRGQDPPSSLNQSTVMSQ